MKQWTLPFRHWTGWVWNDPLTPERVVLRDDNTLYGLSLATGLTQPLGGVLPPDLFDLVIGKRAIYYAGGAAVFEVSRELTGVKELADWSNACKNSKPTGLCLVEDAIDTLFVADKGLLRAVHIGRSNTSAGAGAGAEAVRTVGQYRDDRKRTDSVKMAWLPTTQEVVLWTSREDLRAFHWQTGAVRLLMKAADAGGLLGSCGHFLVDRSGGRDVLYTSDWSLARMAIVISGIMP
jgi:hypothetical protein